VDPRWSKPPVAIQGGAPRVSLDIDVLNFKNVDLNAGQVYVKVIATLSWFDARLKFYSPAKELPENLWAPEIMLK
jgi:hypothetical protein